MPTRNLHIILPDQIDAHALAATGFNASRDAIWMAEPGEELRQLRAHKQKIAFTLAAMRAFRDARRAEGITVHYTAIPKGRETESPLDALLAESLRELHPEQVVLRRPGSWQLRETLRSVTAEAGVALAEEEDPHFYADPDDFADFMSGRKSPLLEHYYRRLRRRFGVLMTEDGNPVGGQWNLDQENRKSFGTSGPGETPAPPVWPEDPLRREVATAVERHFADHPGAIDLSLLPITPAEAEEQLQEFVERRLPAFGDYQDAMWTGADYLYHSRLSAALNLKLLDPRRVVAAAEAAHAAGRAPLNAVEGFVRQIIGWREYIRGLYWHYMPDYAGRNALEAREPLPPLFWDGNTKMACLADSMRSLLADGYTHHIQRLMVLGLFSMLAGSDPEEFHRWHLAMYPDAHDWVSLPNAIGMSQFADGGLVGTKPYAASGKYIQRMSNYCSHCPFDPAEAAGEDACPFTALYWDFLARHEKKFAGNRRMTFQMKNLSRKAGEELAAIRARAEELRRRAREGEL